MVLVLAMASCSDDTEPVTKAELQQWLEESNSDITQTDPACVLDPLWEAGLSNTELREFIDYDGPGPVPASKAGEVYVRVRDECAAELMDEACREGLYEPIECGVVPPTTTTTP